MLIYLYFQVAVSVYAELQQPTSRSWPWDTEPNTAQRIIEQYQHKIDLPAEDPDNKILESALSQLVPYRRQMMLVPTNSANRIRCTFICLHEQNLKTLRKHFESGVMKNVLREVFTLLVNVDKFAFYGDLEWDSEDYLRSVQQFNELRSVG